MKKKNWAIRFCDDHSDTIKTISPIPKNFILPRIGDYLEFSEDDPTEVVVSVHHAYWEKEIIIFTDCYADYEELLKRRNGCQFPVGIKEKVIKNKIKKWISKKPKKYELR